MPLQCKLVNIEILPYNEYDVDIYPTFEYSIDRCLSYMDKSVEEWVLDRGRWNTIGVRKDEGERRSLFNEDNQ